MCIAVIAELYHFRNVELKERFVRVTNVPQVRLYGRR